MPEVRTRVPSDCVYRVAQSENDDSAVCKLLTDISGVQQHPALQVPHAACQACCNSQVPSRTDPNSVVASLLVGLAEQIEAQGGVDECTADDAKQLALWAEKCLPAVSYDEDDTHDLASAHYHHLEGITADQIAQHIPIPEDSQSCQSDLVIDWSVGITSSPRRLPTLPACIESVIKAGWTPTLFLEGDVVPPEQFSHLETCHRTTPSGAFPNYVLSLTELFMREPSADAYLLVQDDAIFIPSPATRTYLEKTLWPSEGPCIASLYCSKKYTQMHPGWHIFPDDWVWGAVAFAFSNQALRQVLSSSTLLEHRAQPGRDGLSKIDVTIGRIARENNIPIIFPSPSLTQHIGSVSTIWDHARAVNARCADQFVGDLIEP